MSKASVARQAGRNDAPKPPPVAVAALSRGVDLEKRAACLYGLALAFRDLFDRDDVRFLPRLRDANDPEHFRLCSLFEVLCDALQREAEQLDAIAGNP